MRSLPYDPARAFTPLVRLATGYVMLVVQPDVPARSLAEFLALLRARPGEFDYASPGNGTAQHMTMELFRLTTGTSLNHIPYRGTAPAVQDLVGRRVATMMLPVPVALPLVRGGLVRALAIGADARLAEAPEVPTFAEAGVEMGDITLWYGLFGPAGMAPDLVQRFNAAANAWLAEPATRDLLRAQGLVAAGGDAEGFRAFVAAELARWAGVVRDARITPD
jgi:tripartite-type tricarboxylate transporter receptor subunit TctC